MLWQDGDRGIEAVCRHHGRREGKGTNCKSSCIAWSVTMGTFSDYLATGKTLKESINDKYLFKSVFMAGGTGSGKSMIADSMFRGMSIMFVNSDEAFEYYLKKEDLPFTIDASNKEVYAKQIEKRQAAKNLTKNRVLHWIDGMLPLVLDGTGKDFEKIQLQKNLLEYTGYDTSMVYVNASLEVSIKRNMQRDRKVDKTVAEKIWHESQENMGKFQELFGSSNFIIIDNSKELSSDEIEKFKVDMTRRAMKLIESPLKNKVGISILKRLEETRGSYLHDLAGELDTKQVQKIKI